MLTKRNQYLREMGIDVWVERGQARPATAPVDAPVEAANDTAPAREQPASAVPAPTDSAPPPVFHLCFATYGGLSLIFSVPQDSNSLPENLRRFADDIASALQVSDKPVINALRWPLVRSAEIDQSAEAARTVLDDRLSRCAPLRVVFGETAKQWAGQGDDICVPDIGGYLEQPLTKRELWRKLKTVSV